MRRIVLGRKMVARKMKECGDSQSPHFPTHDIPARRESQALFRARLHGYTGRIDQYEFFRQYEDLIGLGLWCDF
jgi:hypothetical protein